MTPHAVLHLEARSPTPRATSWSSPRTRPSATSSTSASPTSRPTRRARDRLQTDDLHGRDDHLLLGRAVRCRQRTPTAATSTTYPSDNNRRLPEALDPDAALSGRPVQTLPTAHVPVDARPKAPAATACRSAGRELQQPARRRHDGRDLVHEQHDLPGRHRPLLARARRRRDGIGLTWSAPERSSGRSSAGAEPATRPTVTCCPSGRGRRSRARLPTTSRSTRPTAGNATSRHPTPGISFIKMTGTGVFHWRVRAEFPKARHGEARALLGDADVHAHDRAAAQPRTGSARPRPAELGPEDRRQGVQGADRQDARLHAGRSDSPPTTRASRRHDAVGYQSGGTLYWRVAGVDEDRNQGDWTLSRSSSCRGCASRSWAREAQEEDQGHDQGLDDDRRAGWGRCAVRVTGPGMKPVSGSRRTRSETRSSR